MNGQLKVTNWISEQVCDLVIIQLEEEIPQGFLPMQIDYHSEPEQLRSKALYKVCYGRFSGKSDIALRTSNFKMQLVKKRIRFCVPVPNDGKTCKGDPEHFQKATQRSA